MKITQTTIGAALLAWCAGCADLEQASVEDDRDADVELAVSEQALTIADFHGWQSIPSGTASAGPAATSRGSNLDVYIRGGDNQFWYNYWSELTGWLGYSPVGGVFTSKPSVTSFQGSSIVVAGKGTDNKIWVQAWQPPSGGGHPVGGGWLSIPGGPFVGAPAVAYYQGAQSLFAFARKNSGFCATLLSDTLVSSASAALSASASDFMLAPAATAISASPGLGELGALAVQPRADLLALDRIRFIPERELVALACTRTVYFAKNQLTVNASGQLIYDHSKWTAWTAIPGLNATSEPAAVEAGGKIVVAARGPGNAYYLASSYGSSWSGWSAIPGGTFSSGPALTAYGYGDLQVIGRGMDNYYWGATRDYDTWSGFAQIPGQAFDSPPGAASLEDGHFFVLGTIASGVVRANEYED